MIRAARIHLIGNRPFWLCDDDGDPAGFVAAFEERQAAYEPGGERPIGFCVLVEDRETMTSRREVVWPDTGLRYAGYTASGRQVRLRYFDGALVLAPGRAGPTELPPPDEAHDRFRPDDEYVVAPPEDARVALEDVIALWRREEALDEAEARRRVHEVRLVAVHAPTGELAAIATVYLVHNRQLRLDLWATRAFVTPGHRRSNLAAHLGIAAWDDVERCRIDGADRRGSGFLVEVQDAALRLAFPQAMWPLRDFAFIGQSGEATTYVSFFPDAVVPLPPD